MFLKNKKSSWQSPKICLDQDINVLSDQIRVIQRSFLSGALYIVMPKMFLNATKSFIQLGGHMTLDSNTNPMSVALELIMRYELKVEKSYDLDMSDTCYFCYRPKVVETKTKVKEFKVSQYRELPLKKREQFGRIKSHYLSDTRIPYSFYDKDYGKECDNSEGMVLNHHEKLFKYNRYYIKRDYISASEICSMLCQWDINTKSFYNIFCFIDTKYEGYFTRRIKDMLLYINDKGEILKMEGFYKNIKTLSPVIKDYPPNKKFITMDLECYKDENGLFQPYLLSVCYDGKETKSYYSNDGKSEAIFDEAFNDILVSKYNGYRIYFHNMAKFDGVLLLNYLETKWTVKTRFRKSTSLMDIRVSTKLDPIDLRECADLGKKRRKRVYSVLIKDSLLLLPASLDVLCKNFDISMDDSKTSFPHDFVTKDRLNYVGVIPAASYWPQSVKDIPDNNVWSLKDEAIKYCERDVRGLYNVLMAFHDTIYLNYAISMNNYPTLPALTMQIFLSNFYDETSSIPIIKGALYKLFKQSYFGGFCEAIIPYGEDLIMYDANSLYPSVAQYDMPCGTPIYTTEKDLSKIFGFVRARITVPTSIKVPFIPKRLPDGRVCHPTGTWDIFIFSELLKCAVEMGCNIEKIYESWVFQPQKNVFTKFCNHFYEIKSSKDSGNSLKFVSKLMLNSLIGKFGASQYETETKIMTSEEADILSCTHNINKIESFQNGLKELVNYDIYPDAAICEQHNINYEDKLLEFDTSSWENNRLSMPIASAITAYGRIYLAKFLNIPGNSCYYADTDGFILKKEVDPQWVGTKMLQLKKVDDIRRAYLIAPKSYMYVTQDNQIIQKVKGFGDKLCESDFINLLNGGIVSKTKDEWKVSLIQSSVQVREKPYTIQATSLKRKKLFDDSGKWIGTIPLHVLDDEILD